MEALKAILNEKAAAEVDFARTSARVDELSDVISKLDAELACRRMDLAAASYTAERQMELIDALTRAASLLEACSSARAYAPTQPAIVSPDETTTPVPFEDRQIGAAPQAELAQSVSDLVREHLKLRAGRNFTAREMTDALLHARQPHDGTTDRAFLNSVKTALRRLAERGAATSSQSTRGVVYQWRM